MYKYTAVIVEPRIHLALPSVLNNFLTNLNDDWGFIIFHGNVNKTFVLDTIKNKLSSHEKRISLINLNVDNLTINQYNELLTSYEFYEKIPTETFLIFQTDSGICSKNKDIINEFLEYDYVGSPWYVSSLKNKNSVGNGGLSLRKKTKMIERLSNLNELNNLNEDEFFSSSNTMYFPTKEKAVLFGVEQVYNIGSFGFHKSLNGKYLNNTANDAYLCDCPEAYTNHILNIEYIKSVGKPINNSDIYFTRQNQGIYENLLKIDIY